MNGWWVDEKWKIHGWLMGGSWVMNGWSWVKHVFHKPSSRLGMVTVASYKNMLTTGNCFSQGWGDQWMFFFFPGKLEPGKPRFPKSLAEKNTAGSFPAVSVAQHSTKIRWGDGQLQAIPRGNQQDEKKTTNWDQSWSLHFQSHVQVLVKSSMLLMVKFKSWIMSKLCRLA